ncbi:Rpn family recombination-promoting nuclease/putative transposase, partial [Escherichia coli]|uniref:Rpn family recombination-promoting nuclease/putative transposase n=1 Tax=Escherichia coli TaxID=562 RepID=UPI002079EFE6
VWRRLLENSLSAKVSCWLIRLLILGSGYNTMISHLGLIRTFPSGSQLVAMQNYMLQRGHTEQADLFYGVLRDRETGGESMMTLAQWFEEKGIEKGIQQGRQEVSQEFAQRLLSKGMSREDVAEMANLPLAEIDKVINLI